mmetsp:Transcript_27353/g.56864  ORF Transcript_27353/g.56864 Transcript_27353/m.56864 type:complete len:107 (+) Transcript_27353:109-429(+)
MPIDFSKSKRYQYEEILVRYPFGTPKLHSIKSRLCQRTPTAFLVSTAGNCKGGTQHVCASTATGGGCVHTVKLFHADPGQLSSAASRWVARGQAAASDLVLSYPTN